MSQIETAPDGEKYQVGIGHAIRGKDANGVERAVGVTNTSANVHLMGSGTIGTPENRKLSAVQTYARATNGANFTSAAGISECYITAVSASGSAVLGVFGATSEGQASSWLGDAGGSAVKVQVYPFQSGVRQGPYRFTNADGTPLLINWIDFKVADATATIYIEGVH